VSGHFDTLVYTDCRPGEGLRGTAGLQFQASSPGVTREAMAVVQRSLLYEPPPRWMLEGRPPGEYPVSFAHIWDGHLATARGCYRGKEANGTREGNHLTHAVLTDDAQSYGLVRPAQLFPAPFWRDAPAPTTESPAVEPGWQPGPWDAEHLQGFVAGQPDGAERLVALVSALQRLVDPTGRRVLFVAEDSADVLQWIAAATLLVPQRQALGIGFKVFTTNPAYAAQQVLAVHPDWDSSRATVEHDLGYIVFDLVRGVGTDVPETTTARAWVELFLTDDAFDVVDAVEVADACGEGPPEALEVALVAGLHRLPAAEAAHRVVAWLEHGPTAVVDAYVETVVDVLLGGGPSRSGAGPTADVLHALDRVMCSGRCVARAAAVRTALIPAAVHDARGGGAAVTGPLPPVPPEAGWGEAEERAATADVVEALRGAAPAEFDAVLRTARLLGVPVVVADLDGMADDFVAGWVDDPERTHDLSRWPCGEQVTDLLRDTLRVRVGADDGAGQDIGRLWWARLLDTVADLADPLDAALVAGAMAAGDPPIRSVLVEQFGSAEALWRHTSPRNVELRSLLRSGAPWDPALLVDVLERVRHDPALAPDDLDLCHELQQRRLVSTDAAVLDLLAADTALRTFCTDLVAGEPRVLSRVRKTVEETPERLLVARSDDVVTAMLTMVDPTRVQAMLAVLPAAVASSYAHRLAERVAAQRQSAPVAVAFYLICVKDQREEVSAPLDEAMRAWRSTVPPEQVTATTAKVDATLVPEAAALWSGWLAEEPMPARGRRWSRKRER
jgi:hypothetical protein